jgi:hypothetical protein
MLTVDICDKIGVVAAANLIEIPVIDEYKASLNEGTWIHDKPERVKRS